MDYMQSSLERFMKLGFEDFRRMALDNSLSCYEKIGFPNEYREGLEELIFEDIKEKLSLSEGNQKVILDVGPGVSGLPHFLINLCRERQHTLFLADSPEVLSHLPNEHFIVKYPGFYPKETPELFSKYVGKVDVILCYSVFHYIFIEGNIFDFLDKSLSLLAEGGKMLIGDIPNISKRKRFFSSANGIRFHKKFMQCQEAPDVKFNKIEIEKIDDAVIFSILSRCRNFGFDAYIVPQKDCLPMSNRREDILIRRP